MNAYLRGEFVHIDFINIFPEICDSHTHTVMTPNRLTALLSGNMLCFENRRVEELLLVLKYLWLPLYNNLIERQIRKYVKHRKISGSTRSVLGQHCRDTFASLKKTCRLHGVSFSQFLKDRITASGIIPKLSDMVRENLLSCGVVLPTVFEQ